VKNKKAPSTILTWLLVTAFLVLIVAAVMAPRPIDWRYSFSKNEDKPFGNSLVFKSLPALFPGKSVMTAWSSPSGFLEDKTPLNTNFIFINQAFNLPSAEVKRLLEVAEAGNHIFIAAEGLGGLLADTFHLSIFSDPQSISSLAGIDSVGFNFANRRLKTVQGYWYSKWMTRYFFTRYDSVRTTVLGHDHKGKTNFIRVKQGDGAFYFHCNPVAFTNYHLLSGNHGEYMFKALSYLPNRAAVWDEHYKPGRKEALGLFNYVLESRSLKLAWYLVLFMVLVYFLFGSKRQQRAVPVVEKPVNTTLSFAESVARLYYSRGDHLDIARKRFTYFLEFLRSRYYIDTGGNHQKIIAEVALKSGIRERTVEALFKVAGNLERVRHISAEDLEQFNRQIEFFYNNCR
jgi:hypothetical protein